MPSFEKRDSGTWSVRFRQDGKNLRLSGFISKREAQKAYYDYLAKDEPIVTRDEKKIQDMTFEQLFDEYVKDLNNHCKESSVYTIRNKVYKNILPIFKDMKVSSINALIIQQWQNDLDGSVSYRIGLRELLASILKFANRIYDIPYVMPKVTPIRNKDRNEEMTVWTRDQFNEFIKYIKDEPYQTLFILLYYTGMRKGEARALTWADINGNEININKTATNKVLDAPYAITAPKTKGSYRKIKVPMWVADRINKLDHRGTYIFSLDGENPISERPIENRWRDAIKESGLPQIRIHDLRHSHASYLISKGIPITAVSRRLGHDNVTVTLNTYAHMLPSDDEAVLKVLT